MATLGRAPPTAVGTLSLCHFLLGEMAEVAGDSASDSDEEEVKFLKIQCAWEKFTHSIDIFHSFWDLRAAA